MTTGGCRVDLAQEEATRLIELLKQTTDGALDLLLDNHLQALSFDHFQRLVQKALETDELNEQQQQLAILLFALADADEVFNVPLQMRCSMSVRDTNFCMNAVQNLKLSRDEFAQFFRDGGWKTTPYFGGQTAAASTVQKARSPSPPGPRTPPPRQKLSKAERRKVQTEVRRRRAPTPSVAPGCTGLTLKS